MIRTQSSQVITTRQDGGGTRWLGQLGHVNQLKYSFVMPGGCEAASWMLNRPPTYRSDAMDPGRLVKIYRGSGTVWKGTLDEPVPGPSGWTMTAHGSGTYGANIMCNSEAWDANSPLNDAIANGGLQWKNPGITSSVFLTATPPDPYSQTITDFMNGLTVQAGLLWYVDRLTDHVNVINYPSSVNRLITSTEPLARTLVANVNKIILKYQSAEGYVNNPLYAFTAVENVQSRIKYGSLQTTIDLTPASGITSGPAYAAMTEDQAQAIGAAVLTAYQTISYSDPITIRFGQLLTKGGTPIDPGTDQAGTVARLLAIDSGYGGEVAPGPVTFVVGRYEYDDDSLTAVVTPIQSYRTDIASLLAVMVPSVRQ
jgi:hypothetical protein